MKYNKWLYNRGEVYNEMQYCVCVSLINAFQEVLMYNCVGYAQYLYLRN